MFALGKKHEIEGKIKLKSDKIEKFSLGLYSKARQQYKHLLKLFSQHNMGFLA